MTEKALETKKEEEMPGQDTRQIILLILGAIEICIITALAKAFAVLSVATVLKAIKVVKIWYPMR